MAGMYVLIETTENGDDGPDWENVLFAGTDLKVMNAAADLLSGANISDIVSYDVQELAVLERKNLLALGEFLRAHGVNFE
jgi:hypothetical protein